MNEQGPHSPSSGDQHSPLELSELIQKQMEETQKAKAEAAKEKSKSTFWGVFFKGLAFSLPSVLTIVIIVWLMTIINNYIITPTTWMVQYSVASLTDRSKDHAGYFHVPEAPSLPYCGHNYEMPDDDRKKFLSWRSWYMEDHQHQLPSEDEARKQLDMNDIMVPMGKRMVPYEDFEAVASKLPENELPRTARGIYMELVVFRHFQGLFHISAVAIIVLIMAIYFLGKVVTAQIGAWVVRMFEHTVIGGVPLVRDVYGAVKQITDFLFSDQKVEYRRVAAIEYPRKGIWSIGFVTGESFHRISQDAGEPCVSILIPTSPMPMTGYTMNVPKSSVIDLNISVEEALQYIVSCGVLVSQQHVLELPFEVEEELAHEEE
jgi:uncharacterized membrane protein